MVVVPALNLTPEPDPVVPIAGGPGQGSVEFYTSYSWAFEDVRRNRDILLIDQRGTGESASMDCEFDDDLIEGEYSTELTIQYTTQCLEQLPYDARFFTTSVAVTDIEAVRVSRSAIPRSTCTASPTARAWRSISHAVTRSPRARSSSTASCRRSSLWGPRSRPKARRPSTTFSRDAPRTRPATNAFRTLPRTSKESSPRYARSADNDQRAAPEYRPTRRESFLAQASLRRQFACSPITRTQSR